VAAQREGVLLVPPDRELPRQDLRGLPHVQSRHRIRQSELQRDHRLEVARTEPRERGEPRRQAARPRHRGPAVLRLLGEQERDARHRLDSPRHDEVRLPGADPVRRLDDALDPRGAVAAHGERRDLSRDLGLEGDHPCDVRRVRRTRDVPDDDLVDRLRVDLGPLDRLAHDDAAELDGADAAQHRARLDERRPCACHDDDVAISEHEDSFG